MARQWERVDEDTTVGPRFGQDPPPSFSAPALACTYRQWKRDLRLWQATSSLQKKPAGEMAFKTSPRWELDCSWGRHGRCFGAGGRHWFDRGRTGPMLGGHARPRQSVEDRKGPLRDTKGRQNGDDLHVPRGRRKQNFEQLEKALGTPLAAVIKGYETLRDAKLAESSNDKVVMWTGGTYDYGDVMRALVRLDRPEMRPGSSGQSGKTVPIYFHTRKWMHQQSFQVPRFGHNQVWTDRTGTRSSTHCKRTSISARTERRQSHAME